MFKPIIWDSTDSIGIIREQYVMVDSIKWHREVKEDATCNLFIVNGDVKTVFLLQRLRDSFRRKNAL